MVRSTKLRLVGLAVIVGAAAGGIAYAAIPNPLYGDATACYKLGTGQLRVIDTAGGETCRTSEGALGLYQGYTQLIKRPVGPSGPPNAAFTPIVGSSLLGSGLASFYAVTGKAVIETQSPAESRCRLTAERSDVPKYVLDESRNAPATKATHNLQGIVPMGTDVRVECTADQGWSALESSILGVKVGRAADAIATDATPISP